MKEELSGCIGSRLSRLDCATVTDADLERLSDLTRGFSCTYLSQAIPADGDLLSLTCRLGSVGCVAAVTPAPERAPTKFPIVLVNGIDASPLFRYSPRILKVMQEEAGLTVFLATLPPYEAPFRRAPLLRQRVDEVLAATGAEKVNLVCHSLGGLDCRYLVSPNGLNAAHRVASITTVGTSHRGTRIADAMLGLLPDADRGQHLDDFATLVGDWFTDQSLTDDVHLREALLALTESQSKAFNADIADAPGVLYQSWAGYSRPFGEADLAHDTRLRALCGDIPYGRHDYMALTLVPFTDVVGKIGDDFIPNDGLTAVDSAKWGEFQGCIPADHQEQLGQYNLPDVNVQNGFDIARFYANVGTALSARGL